MNRRIQIFISATLLLAFAHTHVSAETMVFHSIAGQDGTIKESGEDTHRGDAANTIVDGDLEAGDTAFRKQIKLLVSFNTTVLPVDAVVTHAELRLRRKSQTGTSPFNAIGPAFADIRVADGFNGQPGLVARDFEARADGTEVAEMSKPNADGAWSVGVLDTLGRRGIKRGGRTQFRVYHLPDDNDNGNANFVSYYAGEAGVDNAPQLVVEYTRRPAVARPQALIPPDRLHGLRTKWDKYFPGTSGATRGSIPPLTRGLSPAAWAQAIERSGANGCTINVEARNNLLLSAQIPIRDLTPEQISLGQFTPDQRNAEQMRFLLGLEQVREDGRIRGAFRFHAHQRLYPNEDAQTEQEFVDDFSGFINCARAFELDHWLRGIRLGENGISSNRLWYTMDRSKWWAEQINAKTDDWLKTHGMEVHGAELGIYFNGIDTKSNAGTFFQRMSEQTGYFAWCFKLFIDGGLNAALADAGYPKTVENIKTFLRTECGFANLETFIAAYRATQPMHANCIFVGDSGDAMRQLGNKEHQALTQLFNEAGDGFRGIVAMNGYSWEAENDIGNLHKALYQVDPTGTEPQLHPASYARWSAWPNIETGATDPVETIDAHLDQDFSHALDTAIDSGPDWLAPTNGVLSGIPRTSDLGVNAFRIRSASGEEKTLLVTVLDQLYLGPAGLSTGTAPGRDYDLLATDDLSQAMNSTGNTYPGDGSTWNISISTNAPRQYYRMRISR